jgi:hypothetical protein
MGNSLKVTLTKSSSPANRSLSSHNENNNANFYSQYMPPPMAYSYYSGWPPYPLSSYPSSYPPSYLPSQYLPSSSNMQFASTNTSLDITSQSTSQIQQPSNNNIITKPTEPSLKNFLEELDKNFGEGKYTTYLQKFEKEEITVLQIAEMNSEILLKDFGIEILGRRLNIIKEAKKYL